MHSLNENASLIRVSDHILGNDGAWAGTTQVEVNWIPTKNAGLPKALDLNARNVLLGGRMEDNQVTLRGREYMREEGLSAWQSYSRSRAHNITHHRHHPKQYSEK